RTVIADLSRKFYGGWQNSFQYKNWNLSFLFEFVKQKGIDPISTLGTPGNLANNHVDSLDRWQQNNPNGKLQGFTQAFDFGYYNYIASDAIIVNASFIRMKSLSLNYQLPNSLLRNLKIQNGQVYMNAQNLFTISPYK